MLYPSSYYAASRGEFPIPGAPSLHAQSLVKAKALGLLQGQPGIPGRYHGLGKYFVCETLHLINPFFLSQFDAGTGIHLILDQHDALLFHLSEAYRMKQFIDWTPYSGGIAADK